MKDGVTKNAGNSRYLRGAGWPATYEEFRQLAAAGKLPFDLAGINPAGWAVIGDALNKGNLLPDDVAAALGLSGNPQVKDALRLLQKLGVVKDQSKHELNFFSQVEGVYTRSVLDGNEAHFTQFNDDYTRAITVTYSSTEAYVHLIDVTTHTKLWSRKLTELTAIVSDVHYVTKNYFCLCSANSGYIYVFKYSDDGCSLYDTITLNSWGSSGFYPFLAPNQFRIKNEKYLYFVSSYTGGAPVLSLTVYEPATKKVIANCKTIFSWGSRTSNVKTSLVITNDGHLLVAFRDNSSSTYQIYSYSYFGADTIASKTIASPNRSSPTAYYDDINNIIYVSAPSEEKIYQLNEDATVLASTDCEGGLLRAYGGRLYRNDGWFDASLIFTKNSENTEVWIDSGYRVQVSSLYTYGAYKGYAIFMEDILSTVYNGRLYFAFRGKEGAMQT